MSEQAVRIDGEPLSQTASSLRGGLHGAAAGLTIGLIALALLFHTEVVAAVQTWIRSTAYNHCFLVIPIAAWLIWDRRPSLRGITAAPMPLVALLALPLGIVWLAAERLGIMEGRQLVAVTLVEVLFLTMLGRRLYLAMLGPLLYLYFLVPFGEFLTPQLQDLTTWFSRHGLAVLGIPAYIDGYIIEIPEGTFFVAEACAGLRFLIASIAFGALYSIMMYRSPWRRVIFIIASIIVPIVANGFRALGIVVLGHILGSAEAAAADHVLYGWIFFSIVILMLTLLGLPFREDNRPDPAPASPMIPDPNASRRGLLAGIALAVLAALGPAIVLGLNQAAAAPDTAPKPLNLSPSCLSIGEPAPMAASPLGHAVSQRMDCGGIQVTLVVEVFSPRSTAAAINAERRRLSRPQGADDITETPLPSAAGDGQRAWRLIRANEPAFIALAGMWIDGEPPPRSGLQMRLEMARTSVAGTTFAPVLITMTPVTDWGRIGMREKERTTDQLMAVIRENPGIGDQVRAIAAAGAR
jgi:exosortase A